MAAAAALARRRRARTRSTCTPSPSASKPGEPVTLTADVVDDSFVELNDARVVAQGHGSAAATIVDVPMQWTGERNGEYRGTFVVAATRACTRPTSRRRARASRSATAPTHVRAAPGDAEYFDATMHAARLKRIADETGGTFYTPETMAALPEDLKYTGRGVTTVEERDLWHMPIVLLAARRR